MSDIPSEEDYEKVKLVGGGSFGQVYKARRKDDKKQICALKYISKKKSSKHTSDARNEIYILERLRHPHIVQLLTSFETDHHIVLVCEYAVKELFKAYKNEWKGKFSEEKARQISCQICSGLFYLHSQKVLHRDLKPQNVLVTKEGAVKLCDFGFAKFMGDTYYAKTIQGTLWYMAPELFSENSHVHYTEKVDLWSLGCIIYELCVGKPAFASKSIKEMCKMHENLLLPKDLSDPLKDLLKKLLASDHHHRIPWPYILKHKWFKNGIEVSNFDLSRDSPYTRPEIASEKRKEYQMKVRMIRHHRRRPHGKHAVDGEKKHEVDGERKHAADGERKEVAEKVTTFGVECPDGATPLDSDDEFEGAGEDTTDGELLDDFDDIDLEGMDFTDGDEEAVDTVILIIYDEDEDSETGT